MMSSRLNYPSLYHCLTESFLALTIQTCRWALRFQSWITRMSSNTLRSTSCSRETIQGNKRKPSTTLLQVHCHGNMRTQQESCKRNSSTLQALQLINLLSEGGLKLRVRVALTELSSCPDRPRCVWLCGLASGKDLACEMYMARLDAGDNIRGGHLPA